MAQGPQMIRTRVVEAAVDNLGKVTEKEIGWCALAEVPVEKKAPQPVRPGEAPVQPMAIKVNGANYFVIGHSWDISTVTMTIGTDAKGNLLVPESPPEATLILIVQKIEVSTGGIVKAPASAMRQVEALMPAPGMRKAN